MFELFETCGEKMTKIKPNTFDDKNKTETKRTKRKTKPEIVRSKKKVHKNVKERPSKDVPADSSTATVDNSQTNFIQRRVAKDFNGEIYFGTVTAYDDSDNPPFWKIEYDDGDKEEYDKNDLLMGLKLYKKVLR